MENYEPNSHKSKKSNLPDKNVKKVISGTATVKKKGIFSKLTSLFVPEDTESVGGYILVDIVVPLIKKAVSDTVDALLYPGGGGRSRSYDYGSKVSYRRFSDESSLRPRKAETSKRMGYNYAEVRVDTRGEAEAVISSLEELISVYGMASVADLYDLVDVDGSYTDNNYGWTDIRTAIPIRIRDGGYVIKLPRALPLN